MDLQSAKAEISRPPALRPQLILGEIILVISIAALIAFIFD